MNKKRKSIYDMRKERIFEVTINRKFVYKYAVKSDSKADAVHKALRSFYDGETRAVKLLEKEVVTPNVEECKARLVDDDYTKILGGMSMDVRELEERYYDFCGDLDGEAEYDFEDWGKKFYFTPRLDDWCIAQGLMSQISEKIMTSPFLSLSGLNIRHYCDLTESQKKWIDNYNKEFLEFIKRCDEINFS